MTSFNSRLRFCTIFCTLCCCTFVNGDIYFPNYKSSQIDTVNISSKEYKQLRNLPNGILNQFVSDFSSVSLTEGLSDLNNLSAGCLIDVMQIVSDISKLPDYVINLLDAEGKPASGVKRGNLFWAGNYDQCLNVESLKSPDTGRYFYGKYCLTNINLLNLPITLGTCVPSSCDENDVSILADIVLNNQKLVNVTVQKVHCAEKEPWKVSATVTIAVCGVVILLVCVGTLVEVILEHCDRPSEDNSFKQITEINYHHQSYEGPSERTGLLASSRQKDEEDFSKSTLVIVQRCRFLSSFSVINNTKKLLNTETSAGHLASLNGLRVLSMWWVILGHSYEFTIIAIDNVMDAREIGKRFTFQGVLNATFSVDTFFFLSGLLVTYLCLKKLQAGRGKLNWAIFYFHRFWRLTPVYAFVLLIWTCLFIYLPSGPIGTYFLMAEKARPLTECTSYWWTNLLYINNFYPYLGDINITCMSWTWYLANDMQFFIFSPLIILLLYRKEVLGIVVSMCLIVASVLVRALVADLYGLHILDGSPTRHVGDYYGKHSPLYDKPYARMAPYLVGMLLGYVLYKTNCKVILRSRKSSLLVRLVVTVAWMIAIATGLSVVYGLYYNYHTLHEVSDDASVAYISLSRFAWSLALGWVVFACCTGYGGPINTLLSSKLWGPLGRLTYCAYLVHPMVLYFYILRQDTFLHYTDYNMVYIYCANLVVSYVVAYVVSMAVEAPMMGLEKHIFSKKK